MVTGAKNSLAIGGAVGTIGIIVAVIDLTGLGGMFPELILSVAGDNRAIAILLLGAASLVLGMGIPVTAAYLITSQLAVPILTEIGISVIVAHLIIFWLSQDSNITPPVALGAYAGAAIARADPWKTGWACFKFAKMLYIMPLLFAYTHILLEGTLIQKYILCCDSISWHNYILNTDDGLLHTENALV